MTELTGAPCECECEGGPVEGQNRRVGGRSGTTRMFWNMKVATDN